ncbi:MAG: DUF433 domain-containing protein [Chitinivibrionales bacterium]|nr:DUF433 domain-containing protein [Chitinivibrionales bacterium]
MKKKIFGRYIISGPRICHGKPTFRGTRIMVSQIIEQLSNGMAWEAIIDEWRGSISREAMAEAIRLAGYAFADHAKEYTADRMVG